MQLKGKKAIVTAGGQGIGRSIAIGLAKAGADVLIQYHSQAQLAQSVVEEITNLGRCSAVVQADFTKDNAPEDFIASSFDILERADILVNCAAAYEYAPLLEITPAALATIHKMNVEVPLRLVQAFGRLLIKRKTAGSIINISSFFSFKPELGNALIAYSKAGLNMLTRCAALELGPHQIRVNGIAPGRTETVSNKALMEKTPDVWQAIIDKIPLGRAGLPEDYAGLAVLLASDESKWITGTTILCDGGYTI